jgi:hypothetical protein
MHAPLARRLKFFHLCVIYAKKKINKDGNRPKKKSMVHMGKPKLSS